MEAKILKVDNGFEVSYNLAGVESKDVFQNLGSALDDVSAKFAPAAQTKVDDSGTGAGSAAAQ